jgi:hypothetical protein
MGLLCIKAGLFGVPPAAPMTISVLWCYGTNGNARNSDGFQRMKAARLGVLIVFALPRIQQ